MTAGEAPADQPPADQPPRDRPPGNRPQADPPLADRALADLTEISSQIQAAVLFDAKGGVLAATPAAAARAQDLATLAGELVAAAGSLGAGSGRLSQLEAAAEEGSVFVVDDGERRIVAATAPQPTVGLVFYDLKSCLRDLGTDAKPKRRRAAKKESDEA